MSDKENNSRAFAAFEQHSEESIKQAVRQDVEPAQNESESGKQNLADRGFAAMDPNLQKEIARKGGTAVSRDRDHMSAIGRKGGEAVSKNREHMSAIGRKGGKAGAKRENA